MPEAGHDTGEGRGAGGGVGRLKKITSVRKGMGSAKYSTLITTIPAEMCRTLGIGPGDSLMWSFDRGAAKMSVSKFGPKAMYDTSALYSKMLQLRKLAKGDASIRAFAEREIKRIEAEFGPMEKLSDRELERERKGREGKMRRKLIRKKGKGPNTQPQSESGWKPTKFRPLANDADEGDSGEDDA